MGAELGGEAEERDTRRKKSTIRTKPANEAEAIVY